MCPYLTLESPHHQQKHCLRNTHAGYMDNISADKNDRIYSGNRHKPITFRHRFEKPIHNVKHQAELFAIEEPETLASS